MGKKHTYLVISGQIDAEVACDDETEAMEEIRKARSQEHRDVVVVKGILHRMRPVEVLAPMPGDED